MLELKGKRMKKNVLIVNNTLGEGGAEKVLIDILNRFDYSKYNVKLLLLKREGVHFNKLNKNVKLKCLYPQFNIKNHFLCRFWNFFQYRTMKHLYKIIYIIYAGLNNDVEIAFLEGEPTKFISRSINKKSKKIAWVHTDLIKCRPQNVNIEDQEVYKCFDDVVCVSNIAKKAFKELYKDIHYDPKVIYNLIEVDRINTLSKEIVDFKFDKPTIVSVGRLTKLKRFDLIIKAHKRLIENGIDNNLIILGIGEEENHLKDLIRKLNVENSVHMLGFIDNPYPYIKKSDIFVTASEFEGFSLVVAEALSLGKSIVSTSNGGADELLKNGVFGKLVNVNDLDELTINIENILTNNEVKIKYEEKALLRAEIFKYEQVMSDIYNLLS